MHGSLAERAVRLMDQLLARINQYNKSLALSCLNNTIAKLGHMFLLKKTQTEDRAQFRDAQSHIFSGIKSLR